MSPACTDIIIIYVINLDYTEGTTTICLRVFERSILSSVFICCRSILVTCMAALLAGLEMATISFIH